MYSSTIKENSTTVVGAWPIMEALQCNVIAALRLAQVEHKGCLEEEPIFILERRWQCTWL